MPEFVKVLLSTNRSIQWNESSVPPNLHQHISGATSWGANEGCLLFSVSTCTIKCSISIGPFVSPNSGPAGRAASRQLNCSFDWGDWTPADICPWTSCFPADHMSDIRAEGLCKLRSVRLSRERTKNWAAFSSLCLQRTLPCTKSGFALAHS